MSQTSYEVVARLDEEKKKLDSIASMFPTIPAEMKVMMNTLVDIRAFVSIKVTSELEKISISVEALNQGQRGINYVPMWVFIVLNTRSKDHQVMNILNWLSPLQPQKRHHDIRSLRLNNTGGWLLHDERFTAWCAGVQGLRPEDRILCCYGMPGAGKAVMW